MQLKSSSLNVERKMVMDLKHHATIAMLITPTM
jgi:hypothetical protein